MRSLTANIFPDTLPDNTLIFPLVQVFDTLVYTQPVENDLSVDVEALGYPERLTFHTPAILGGNRDRFLSLVTTLKTQGSDYINQIGNLTIAGLQSGDQQESGNAIVSTLFSKHSSTNQQEEKEMLLWQSRLILKLAEFYDIEQAGLQAELESMSAREESLLLELREAIDSPEKPTPTFSGNESLSEKQLQYRLRAWTRLFFQGEAQLPPADIFITPRKNALDLLADSYENNSNTPPLSLLSMQLPLIKGKMSETDRASSQKAAPFWSAPVIEIIKKSGLAISNEPSPPLTSLEQQEQELATAYPDDHYGRCNLEIFFFPKITACELFHSVFNDPAPNSGKIQDNGVLIGYLS